MRCIPDCCCESLPVAEKIRRRAEVLGCDPIECGAGPECGTVAVIKDAAPVAGLSSAIASSVLLGLVLSAAEAGRMLAPPSPPPSQHALEAWREQAHALCSKNDSGILQGVAQFGFRNRARTRLEVL